MMRGIGLFAGLLLAVFAAGCASESEVKPKNTMTVPLDLGATRTVVKASVADLVTLELPPVELAGFGWQLFQMDTRFLRQTTEVVPPAVPGGRPTIKLLTLRPVTKTTARFLLVKIDGGRETQPVDGHDVVFNIQ